MGRAVRIGVAAAAALAAALLAAAASAQDPCIDCHAAQELDEEARVHLRQFRDSEHAAAGVSCADCHGGNVGTFVELRAHKGVQNSARPASPTNPWNLPQTCGRCHEAEYQALRQSVHHELFERKVRAAPTGSTCHGSVAAQSLGVEGGLQARCGRCHGPEAGHPEAALTGEEGQKAVARGGRNLARQRSLGKQRAAIARAVLRLRDPAERHEAANSLFAINGSWSEAIEAGHAFHWADWENALDTMEASVAELKAALVRHGGN